MGTWVEETDLRPTLLHLAGSTDDYQTDGRVITQALALRPRRSATAALAVAYQQINSSVGEFATDTLIADSRGSRQRFGQQRLGLPQRAGPAAPSRR